MTSMNRLCVYLPTQKKKKRHPDAPKLAQAAYVLFSSEKRVALKSEEPSLNFGEVGSGAVHNLEFAPHRSAPNPSPLIVHEARRRQREEADHRRRRADEPPPRAGGVHSRRVVKIESPWITTGPVGRLR